ncbi:MAG: glycosyltransferase family 2 protein [Clostridia bacterium]|nr:glycosyltransferase family 2 protein [Clostridia bacterium]
MKINCGEKQYPLVSVCTCVYNGEKTLHRVFESMNKITYPNIEHIIVNDGSTDGTEKLIETYSAQATFPVKYHKKENGGKHSALNIAWTMISGELTVDLDADDELLPDSISRLVDTYLSIPENIRDEYWCVHGRCVTQFGDFVGIPYPNNINNHDWRTAAEYASKCVGEKLGLKVVKYLSQYKFPEVVGAHYLSEGIVWRQLNVKYGTWYTNEVVRVYYVNEGGNLSERRTKRSQYGSLAYWFKWKITHPDLYPFSVKDLLSYALCFFVSAEKYRKHNKYFKEITSFDQKIVLFVVAPVMFFGAIVFRCIRHIK